MAKRIALLLLITFFLFCLFFVGFYYFFATFAPAEQEIYLTTPNTKLLHIQQPNGLIHIEAADTQQLEITATKTVLPRLPVLATAGLRSFNFHAETNGERFEIKAKLPSYWLGDGKLDLQIVVPYNLEIQIISDTGNINVFDFHGPLNIDHRGNGVIVFKQLSGPIIISHNVGEIRGELAANNQTPIRVHMNSGRTRLDVRSPNPGPIEIIQNEGLLVLGFHPQINALVTYETVGQVITPFRQSGPPSPAGQRQSAALQLGSGGSAISIKGKKVDLTFESLSTDN